MKKTLAWMLALAPSLGFAPSASAADHLTLQLKWVTQAQFAGYYVAQAKGFYKAEGLDVTIKPGGPDINPSQVIAAGGADVIVDWMPDALAAREKGVPLVNIAQIFEKSGMELTCRKDSGITSPEDFKGKTIGVWFAGNQYPFLAWMGKLGYTTSGADPEVKVLKQGFNVDPLLQKQAACISTMSYNEYWQLIEAGMKPDQLTVFKYQDEGVAMLEDGLYTTDAELANPQKDAELAKFVKASIEGWNYAAAHQAEAVKIVMSYDTAGVLNEAHQVKMMASVAKLLNDGKDQTGYLDPAAYQRTVDVLMEDKTDPVITKRPEGAYTHKVYDAALAIKN
ncbi:ABC transporter substrate-binding protein [Acidocella sp.]|uniref:ABC transporter substrate-binding protein n=1 Tax=Acidocella sp. TaxID=50710 RepID=UPI003D003BD6